MQVLEALEVAARQLKHIGSFDPHKLPPEDKAFLLSTERVYEETFEGSFFEFFGAIAMVYKDAKAKDEDPEQAIKTWIKQEIANLRIDRRLMN